MIVRRYLSLLDPTSSFNGLQIGLDMNLSGLTNYYIKQEVDSRLGTSSRIQVFKYPQESADNLLYKLGTLNLPNGGSQATTTNNACNGYGTKSEGLKNPFTYYIPNYQTTTHIYSTTASESRSVSQGSSGPSNDSYYDEN